MVNITRKVVITFTARASLKRHIKYLKENVSEETAEYLRQGILSKCKGLKDFAGYSVERYLEDELPVRHGLSR